MGHMAGQGGEGWKSPYSKRCKERFCLVKVQGQRTNRFRIRNQQAQADVQMAKLRQQTGLNWSGFVLGKGLNALNHSHEIQASFEGYPALGTGINLAELRSVLSKALFCCPFLFSSLRSEPQANLRPSFLSLVPTLFFTGISLNKIILLPGWGCSSEVEQLPSMSKALGSILSTVNK